LTDLLDGYLSRLERGLPPPREGLLRANPDLALPLQAYFQSLDELHDLAAGFQRPGSASGYSESAAEVLPATGDEKRLGDFRLLREVGRGGMGVVYEAEQISLGRRVALKVLPFAAVLDSRQIARFKHEAQAAAQLNHPNIVSVFAVGVERGVHYYAMQFIDGQPLDRVIAEMRERYLPGDRSTGISRNAREEIPPTMGTWCPAGTTSATQQSILTSRAAGSGEYIRGVVGLGIAAAGALHAAHESGIVHRDIKPSNLLLDGNGKLWVTDFGLARRRPVPGARDAALTRTGDLVGTMRYMSPEQAAGQNALVDHRTDIYSLGATLYELLTLEPAIPGQEGQALLRQIERQDPRPLRQLQPKVPVDLQTVIMKGMAKRREDRYATAQDFADDLQRVLDGKPIVARPPALLDRATRWAQRHREVVAAASAVCLLTLLALAIIIVVIAGEQRKTAQNYALAEKRFREAQDTVERLGLRISDRLAKVPGAAQVRQDLLQQTRACLRDLADQEKDNPELRADLALTYSKIGKLSAEIGSGDDAIEADKRAIRLYEELARANPRDVDCRQRLGVCQNNLGLVLARSGKTDDARQAFDEAIRLQESASTSGPSQSENEEQRLADLALAHGNLGLLQNETGDADGAAVSLDCAAALQQRLLTATPKNPDRMRDLAVTLNTQAALYVERRPEKAIELYEKAADLQDKAAALLPDGSGCRNELALICINMGAVQSRTGAMPQAVESYTRAVDLASELVQRAPAQKSYRHTLARAYNNLGSAQGRLGRTAAAESSYRHALALQEALVQQDPQDLDLLSDLGGMCNNLGTVLEEMKRPSEAVAAYEQAVSHQRQALSQAPEIAKYRQYLSKHYYNYDRALRLTGRADEAVQVALARRDLWPKDPDHLFAVAEEFALAAKELSARSKTEPAVVKCGECAVETLRQAIAAGWKPKPNSDWTKSFTAVKHRPDFLALTN